MVQAQDAYSFLMDIQEWQVRTVPLLKNEKDGLLTTLWPTPESNEQRLLISSLMFTYTQNSQVRTPPLWSDNNQPTQGMNLSKIRQPEFEYGNAHSKPEQSLNVRGTALQG